MFIVEFDVKFNRSLREGGTRLPLRELRVFSTLTIPLRSLRLTDQSV
ncbi:hypothetical protein QFZ67_006813 [Streptomyces sp. V1I1]|nr:hypothetical protein [Streptomyces sp. V1I1]